MRHLDLFSGIGGFALGFQRAGGIQTVAFCDVEEWCRLVLNKNFPGVPFIYDIHKINQGVLDGIGPIDIITAGFPCQDISAAGPKKGIRGERSQLFFEAIRVIRLARPKFVLLENSPRLLSGYGGAWMADVLRELAELGFDALWRVLSAEEFGAPHERKRVWILAWNAQNFDLLRCPGGAKEKLESRDDQTYRSDQSNGAFFDSDKKRCQRRRVLRERKAETARGDSDAGDLGLVGEIESAVSRSLDEKSRACKEWWAAEPAVGRVVHGLPGRVDRIKCLGNSIIPQIAEAWGEAIVSSWEMIKGRAGNPPVMAEVLRQVGLMGGVEHGRS